MKQEEKDFYILNHLDVLGIEKGLILVSYRVDMRPDEVLMVYESKKANQMAV